MSEKRLSIRFRMDNHQDKEAWELLQRISEDENISKNAVALRLICKGAVRTGSLGAESWNKVAERIADLVANRLETDKKHINDIIDWFGSSVNFIKTGEDKYSVTVKATEQAIIFWALQYSQYITVKKPENIIDKIKSALETALEKYSQQ